MKISKNLKGATYDNPYQKPYALNDYSQNMPTPSGKGGGDPYVNPQSVMGSQFFDPTSPNDPAFSDMQTSQEVSSADPIGQIMADFNTAQGKLHNNGGK